MSSSKTDLLACLGGACSVPGPNRDYLPLEISWDHLIGKDFMLSRQDDVDARYLIV